MDLDRWNIYIFDGKRSALAFIESFDIFFGNLHYLTNLYIDFDGPVGIFWRLGYLIFYELVRPLQIKFLGDIFEFIVGAKAVDL